MKIKRILFVLLLVSVLIFSLSCFKSDEKKAEEVFIRYQELREKHDYENAVKELNYIRFNYPKTKYFYMIEKETRELKADELYYQAVEKSREEYHESAIQFLIMIIEQYADTEYYKLAIRDLNNINKKVEELWLSYYKEKDNKNWEEAEKLLMQINRYTSDPKITEEYQIIQKLKKENYSTDEKNK